MEHKQEMGRNEPTLQEIQQMEMIQAHHDHSPSSLSQQNPVAAIVEGSKINTKIEDEHEVSFFHDFIAGGVAGSASVVVGHPLDTLKVRMQTAKGKPSIASLAMGSKYGGPTTMFRGMAAPLSAACAVNAIIFSSYGWSSRLYEQNSPNGYNPNLKAFTCGSFAGLVQALIICPMEHVKCRLQIQETAGAATTSHPLRTTLRTILTSGGSSTNVAALYRGWWITCWREIPAFGAYFSLYDIFKDRIQYSLDQRDGESEQLVMEIASGRSLLASTTMTQLEETTINTQSATTATLSNTTTASNEQQQNKAHKWYASALAGGLTGALTWAIVYPFDAIKTQIQTAPINTPQHERTIAAVTARIIKEHGWKHLFRGLTVTCIRAFPVNGIIFPLYEYTLLHVCALES